MTFPSHRVTVLAHSGLAPFELGVAAEVFALPRPELEVDRWYSFSVCAEQPGVLEALGGFGLVVGHGLEELGRADTIILPGAPDVHGDPSPRLVSALRRAHDRGARLVSICSGAFVLAATGLLDGRQAATHWRYAPLLARRFPPVHVVADVLYVDGEDVLTSAGTAAGIDLCLHLVRKDHGAAIANRVARRMVVAAQRDGGQAQFVDTPVPAPATDDPVARRDRVGARAARGAGGRGGPGAPSAPLSAPVQPALSRRHRSKPRRLAAAPPPRRQPAPARVLRRAGGAGGGARGLPHARGLPPPFRARLRGAAVGMAAQLRGSLG